MRTLRWDHLLLTLCLLLAVALFWAWRRGSVHLVEVEVLLPDSLDARVELVAELSRPTHGTPPVANKRGQSTWEVPPGHWRVVFPGLARRDVGRSTVPFLALPGDDRLTVDLRHQPPDGFVPVPPGRYLRWPDGGVSQTDTLIVAARREVSRRDFATFLQAVAKKGPDRWASEEEIASFPDGLVGYGTVEDQQLDRQRPGEELPAALVNWYAAKAYCRWLTETEGQGAWSYRLPTAMEWDKMARGTDARRHPWGDTVAPVPLLNLGLGPVAVDSHLELASPYGLLHMETNVSEWVEDAFDAAGVRRVVRGGSWSRYGDALRIEARVGSPATRRSPVIGFRVVAEPVR
jgi:hypothetical protein